MARKCQAVSPSLKIVTDVNILTLLLRNELSRASSQGTFLPGICTLFLILSNLYKITQKSWGHCSLSFVQKGTEESGVPGAMSRSKKRRVRSVGAGLPYCPSAFPFSGMRATTFSANTSSGATETQRHYTQDQMLEGHQKLHKMLYLPCIEVNIEHSNDILGAHSPCFTANPVYTLGCTSELFGMHQKLHPQVHRSRSIPT